MKKLPLQVLELLTFLSVGTGVCAAFCLVLSVPISIGLALLSLTLFTAEILIRRSINHKLENFNLKYYPNALSPNTYALFPKNDSPQHLYFASVSETWSAEKLINQANTTESKVYNDYLKNVAETKQNFNKGTLS